ncbi:MAG: hypothetical protein ABJK37_14905 [Paraglaciecola sp.]|uniref:hypothetical protein n=1 Tax=Paraglaciecola sp. TaxID=1920173 RepID=UPI0032992195
MKVIIGKFSHEPFHALSKKDLSLLFKLVPKEWGNHVSSVVLSSKILKKAKLTHAIEYKVTSKQICIYSRGLVREIVAKQLLVELASIALQKEHSKPVVETDLDILVKPYIEKFLKTKV